MSLPRALLLIVFGSVIDCSMASAEELCPAGPFETDIVKIGADMAAKPLELSLSDTSNSNSDTPRAAQLSDGAVFSASGGLGAHVQSILEYDARRYIVRDIEEERPQRDILDLSRDRVPPEPPKPIPHQVIRQAGEVTTTTTTARPTPAQARTFACLANRLLAPHVHEGPAQSPERRDKSRSPPEITVSASPLCTEAGWFTDAHVEGSSFFVSGQLMDMRNSDIPCATRFELREQMRDAVYASIKEVIARGDAN